MKILHFTMWGESTFEKGGISFVSGLEKIASDYYELCYAVQMRSQDQSELNEVILTHATEIKPDIIFMQFAEAGGLKPDTFKALKQIAKVIVWSGDVIAGGIPKWYYNVAEHATCCFSNEDYVTTFKEKGYDSYFFNYFDESLYFSQNEQKTHDIVFAGSKYNHLPFSEYRNNMVRFLIKTYKDNFKVYGNGWDDQGKFASRLEMRSIYQKTKIGINISQADLLRYTSDRIFNIIASGCFCISKHFSGDDIDFTDGVHLRYFDTYEELKKLINFYLKNEKEREKIAKAGNELVREKFGVRNLKKVINEITN